MSSYNIEGLRGSSLNYEEDCVKSLSVPSVVHPYSLAIEYMRDVWFLPKFDGEFKTVYVNGKHVFDDQRKFNRIRTRAIEKPAVAITPRVDTDWNRDTVDLYTGGVYVYSVRNRRYDDRILRDDNKNIYLSMHLAQLQMQFEFRVRVSSRAEQLDWLRRLQLKCRIGSTQGEYLDLDFLLPKDVIIAVALDAGFEIRKLTTGAYEIVDIPGFIKYLNSIARFPITYKFRGISGALEYFIRIPGNYIHISCMDGISYDDGERSGHLDNNFHIDFTATLQMPMPSMLVYYSKKEHNIRMKDDSSIGLYQITLMGPPKKNKKGWSKYIESDYISETLEIDDIPLQDLLDTIPPTDDVKISITRVMQYTVSMGLSPSVFMEIQMFNGQKPLVLNVDWEKGIIGVHNTLHTYISKVAVYVDLGYINTTIANLDHLQDSGRIGK